MQDIKSFEIICELVADFTQNVCNTVDPESIRQITRKLTDTHQTYEDYQQFKKDSKDTLIDRERTLKQLSIQLLALSKNVEQSLAHNKTTYEFVVLDFQCLIQEYITDVKSKAAYLGALNKSYQEYPKGLTDYTAKHPRKISSSQHILLGLDPEYGTESFDPLHRSTKPFSSLWPAKVQWDLQKQQNPDTPDFYLWLEVNDKFLTIDPDESSKSVLYNQTITDKEQYRVHMIEGQLYKLIKNNFELYPATEASEPHAFVIIPSHAKHHQNWLLINEHKEDEFHHSSFNGGKPVISAGMLTVNDNGKIVMISNKSGHYKPGLIEFINAIEYLDRNNVFADKVEINCTVFDVHGNLIFQYISVNPQPVSDFLTVAYHYAQTNNLYDDFSNVPIINAEKQDEENKEDFTCPIEEGSIIHPQIDCSGLANPLEDLTTERTQFIVLTYGRNYGTMIETIRQGTSSNAFSSIWNDRAFLDSDGVKVSLEVLQPITSNNQHLIAHIIRKNKIILISTDSAADLERVMPIIAAAKNKLTYLVVNEDNKNNASLFKAVEQYNLGIMHISKKLAKSEFEAYCTNTVNALKNRANMSVPEGPSIRRGPNIR